MKTFSYSIPSGKIPLCGEKTPLEKTSLENTPLGNTPLEKITNVIVFLSYVIQ